MVGVASVVDVVSVVDKDDSSQEVTVLTCGLVTVDVINVHALSWQDVTVNTVVKTSVVVDTPCSGLENVLIEEELAGTAGEVVKETDVVKEYHAEELFTEVLNAEELELDGTSLVGDTGILVEGTKYELVELVAKVRLVEVSTEELTREGDETDSLEERLGTVEELKTELSVDSLFVEELTKGTLVELTLEEVSVVETVPELSADEISVEELVKEDSLVEELLMEVLSLKVLLVEELFKLLRTVGVSADEVTELTLDVLSIEEEPEEL